MWANPCAGIWAVLCQIRHTGFPDYSVNKMVWEGWQEHQWVSKSKWLCRKWHPASRWDGNNVFKKWCKYNSGTPNPVPSPPFHLLCSAGVTSAQCQCADYKTEMLTRQGKMAPCGDYHSLVKPDLVEVPGGPPRGETLGRTQFKDKKHTLLLGKVVYCLSVMTGRRGGPTFGSGLQPTQRIS